jgi:two-component system, chemotaxis family, protein-glutamate methylesterase/glutaminase
MGVSAGGLQTLKTILPALPADFPLPLAIVQHVGPDSDSFLVDYLDELSAITIKEAEDKEPLSAGHAYFAPPGYHLLIELDRTFSLSVDERVNFARPSVDVLFDSAADVYGQALIGVVLTGANSDGAQGLKTIKARGGLAIAQNPRTAAMPTMPEAAIAAAKVDHICDPGMIASLLTRLCADDDDTEGGHIPFRRAL